MYNLLSCLIVAKLSKGSGAKLKGLRLCIWSYDSLAAKTGYLFLMLLSEWR